MSVDLTIHDTPNKIALVEINASDGNNYCLYTLDEKRIRFQPLFSFYERASLQYHDAHHYHFFPNTEKNQQDGYRTDCSGV